MAKVTMPLGGIRARGQIAKTFVFFPWKGINAVRSYIIPANPNTTAQQSRRTLFTQAVTKFHGGTFNVRDMAALRRKAGTMAKPMTYFNWFVKRHIAIIDDGDASQRCQQDATAEGTSTKEVDFQIEMAGSMDVVAHYGTSKTYKPFTTATFSESIGVYTHTETCPDAGTKYFYDYEVTTASNACISGIYEITSKT